MTNFLQTVGISMTAERADTNPNMERQDMDHWRCVLRAGRSRMTVMFSQGYGHNGKAPDVASVLDCLASDAAGVDNSRDFEDWCSEYGYDIDSRKAERTFKTCERQALKLHKFLGDSAYRTLLWDTERQ
jgi:hypothetical protein